MMKSLDFNLMLKFPAQELEIKDLDMKFELFKTNTPENNSCKLIIWNLSAENYTKLTQKSDIIELYSFYGEEEPALFFRGYLSDQRSEFYEKTPDVPTVLWLVDGKKAYTESYINKAYRTEVSSTKIIADCVEAMGLEFGQIHDELPEKIYPNGYKAVGKPQVVLKSITQALGISFTIQNNVFRLNLPDATEQGEHLPILNLSNSLRPKRMGSDELVIRTEFMPALTPNDYVECDFEEYKGVQKVTYLKSRGDNYKSAAYTEIVIRITNDENV